MTVGTTQLAPGNGHNYIINGAFDINQRELTSTTATSGFAGDRWRYSYATGTTTISHESLSSGELEAIGFGSFTNKVKYAITGQDATSGNVRQFQRIENVNTLAGQTMTISFYAKASAACDIAVSLEKNYGVGGSSSDFDVNPTTASINTSWKKISVTIENPTNAGKTISDGSFLLISFWLSAGTNLGPVTNNIGVNNETIEITGVQLEAGSIATPFKRNANSIQGELAACKRYYQVIAKGNTEAIAMGHYYNSTTFNAVMHYTEMRSTPSLEETTPDGTTYYLIRRGNSFNGLTSLNRIIQVGTTAATINVGSASGASGTQGIGGNLYTNNADSFVALNAEL